jgi:hypothetical protein
MRKNLHISKPLTIFKSRADISETQSPCVDKVGRIRPSQSFKHQLDAIGYALLSRSFLHLSAYFRSSLKAKLHCTATSFHSDGKIFYENKPFNGSWDSAWALLCTQCGNFLEFHILSLFKVMYDSRGLGVGGMVFDYPLG